MIGIYISLANSILILGKVHVQKEEEDMAEPIPKFYHKSSYFQRQIWAKHKIHMCNVSTITKIHTKIAH